MNKSQEVLCNLPHWAGRKLSASNHLFFLWWMLFLRLRYWPSVLLIISFLLSLRSRKSSRTLLYSTLLTILSNFWPITLIYGNLIYVMNKVSVLSFNLDNKSVWNLNVQLILDISTWISFIKSFILIFRRIWLLAIVHWVPCFLATTTS